MAVPEDQDGASQGSDEFAGVPVTDDDIRDFFVHALERIGASHDMLAAARGAVSDGGASPADVADREDG